MTRKHFNRIAAIFHEKLHHPAYAESVSPVRTACLADVAKDLCGVFQEVNPAFDRARFMTACGF